MSTESKQGIDWKNCDKYPRPELTIFPKPIKPFSTISQESYEKLEKLRDELAESPEEIHDNFDTATRILLEKKTPQEMIQNLVHKRKEDYSIFLESFFIKKD